MGGSPGGVGHEVNNSGQVVVHSYWNGKSYISTGGALTQLGTLGGDTTEAYGINDAGVAVGVSETGSGDVHVFSGTTSGLTDLGVSGVGNDINNSNVVVGRDYGGSGFVYDAGAVTYVGSDAVAINDSGTVVGDIIGGDAFVWKAGSGMQTFSGVNFYDISNSDAAVGHDSGGALYWTSLDGLVDLSSLIVDLTGWSAIESAYGISDDGQYIVGLGTTSTGETHNFLLTQVVNAASQVPLPSTVSMILMGAFVPLRRLTRISHRGASAGSPSR